jgi:hypothetical protein
MFDARFLESGHTVVGNGQATESKGAVVEDVAWEAAAPSGRATGFSIR